MSFHHHVVVNYPGKNVLTKWKRSNSNIAAQRILNMASGVLRTGKYAAKAAAAQTLAATALSEPLLETTKRSRLTDSLSDDSDDESSIYSDATSVAGGLAGKNIVHTLGVTLMVTCGMAASAAAIVAVPGIAVFVMGGICIANSPTVAHKYIKIAKSEGESNRMRSIERIYVYFVFIF